MKKRISTRTICLLIAVIMLVGALTVSAINGSPYENLKNAVINALFYENFTVEGEFVMRMDGHVRERSWIRHYYGSESRLETGGNEEFRQLSQEGIGQTPFGTDSGRINHRINYTARHFRINPIFTADEDVQWYTAQRPFQGSEFTHLRPIGYNMFGQAGRNSNYLRLAELAIDIFVGDLKNNLTMNSQGDGIRRISGAITESQLPEMVRVLIDIAIDEQQRWADTTRPREDFADILDIPMRNLTIDRIQGHADIDGDGNLLYVNFLGRATVENIFGDTHMVEIEGALRFSDIGTTMPVSPFAGAGEIFDDLWRTQRQLFFTLDEDGNIDINSITNQWPSPPQITTMEGRGSIVRP